MNNKRIREIAALVHQQHRDGFVFDRGDAEYTVTEAAVNQFADMIIQECINACGAHEDIESFGVHPVRVAMITISCEDNIKSHFGDKTNEEQDCC